MRNAITVQPSVRSCFPCVGYPAASKGISFTFKQKCWWNHDELECITINLYIEQYDQFISTTYSICILWYIFHVLHKSLAHMWKKLLSIAIPGKRLRAYRWMHLKDNLNVGVVFQHLAENFNKVRAVPIFGQPGIRLHVTSLLNLPDNIVFPLLTC